MPPLLQITTLGRLSVERDGQPLSLRRKDLLLLVYIALERRSVSRAEVASLLWGETPDQAARLSLRQAIWRLRTETADAISANTSHITVDHAHLSVDVENLAACVEAGRYREAISLWQGEFLAGADSGATNEFESWVERARAKISQQIALSLSQLVRDAVRTDDWQQAARYAAQWAELAPLDASAVLELARALRAGGKAAEGLARLSEFSRTLADNGIRANAEVDELMRELKRDAVRIPSHGATTNDAAHVQLIKIWEQTSLGRARGDTVSTERASRLFIDWIEARGDSILILRSGETTDVIRALIEGLRNARGLSGAPDDALAELAAWSPSLRDRYPRLPAREPDTASLTSALRRVLDAISVETPICIYIEDACDEESDAILTALMADPPPRTMLLRAVKPKRRRLAVPLVAALVLITSAGLLVSMRRDTHADEPVAVGVIQVIGERDTLGLSHAVPGLLASKLAMSPQLDVISSARLHEVGSPRRAGARTLIEGEMYQQEGEIRLALRRVRLSTGKVEKSYEVSSANVFRLVDEMADQIARSYHVDVPRQSVADVTTTSIVAYRFYEEGLRSFYRNDYAAAYRVFRAALEQDSTFAMAAYYASQSAMPDEAKRLWGIALRLAEHAGDHDRLLIHAQWAVRNGSHDLYPLAETLSIRYPTDAVGQYYYGLANNTAGNFMLAAKHFSKAITLDSMALLGRSTPCRACEAMVGLVGAYYSADSLAAAERAARKWARLQPWSLNGWTMMHVFLQMFNKTCNTFR
ncbi:MAG TPA: BTAD domain-containing putative transcriptional regulator [Longimicrobiales bacterium]|nr:BTAD domain-containing putative transcriptional regulator [Longimicrobiales bacterium]